MRYERVAFVLGRVLGLGAILVCLLVVIAAVLAAGQLVLVLLAAPIVTIELSVKDQMALARSVRGDGGFQGLLRVLQGAWNQAGRGKWLPIQDYGTLDRIRRYADSYGDGGWQSRLRGWVGQLPPEAAKPTQGGLL